MTRILLKKDPPINFRTEVVPNYTRGKVLILQGMLQGKLRLVWVRHGWR